MSRSQTSVDWEILIPRLIKKFKPDCWSPSIWSTLGSFSRQSRPGRLMTADHFLQMARLYDFDIIAPGKQVPTHLERPAGCKSDQNRPVVPLFNGLVRMEKKLPGIGGGSWGKPPHDVKRLHQMTALKSRAARMSRLSRNTLLWASPVRYWEG